MHGQVSGDGNDVRQGGSDRAERLVACGSGEGEIGGDCRYVAHEIDCAEVESAWDGDFTDVVKVG